MQIYKPAKLKNTLHSYTAYSEVNLFQKQHEVSGAFSSTTGRVVQRQLKEREGEATRETEVGDGMQGRQSGWTALRQSPSSDL